MTTQYVIETACTVAWSEHSETPDRGMRIATKCYFCDTGTEDLYQLQRAVQDHVAQQLDHRQADNCASPQEVVQWILTSLQYNFPSLAAVECEVYPGIWIKQTVPEQ